MVGVRKYAVITSGGRMPGTDLGIGQCTTKGHQPTYDPGGKKTPGVNASFAELEAVLKMPIPITSPITIMVRSNKLSLDFIRGR